MRSGRLMKASAWMEAMFSMSMVRDRSMGRLGSAPLPPPNVSPVMVK